MTRWSDKDLKSYNKRRAQGAAAPSRPAKTGDDGGAVVRKRKEPNRTEREYESVFLKPQMMAGEITSYFFEQLTLLVAVDTRYTPDFLVRRADGRLELREIKGGYKREDAFVKFKAAAEMFGALFDFLLCEKLNSGEWKITRYAKGDSHR